MNYRYSIFISLTIIITILMADSLISQSLVKQKENLDSNIQYFYAEYHPELSRFKIEILFAGMVKVYKQTSSGKYRLKKRFTLSEKNSRELKSLFINAEFKKLPRQLPRSGKNFPITRAIICCRYKKSEPLKSVQLYLLPPKKYSKVIEIVNMFRSLAFKHLR